MHRMEPGGGGRSLNAMRVMIRPESDASPQPLFLHCTGIFAAVNTVLYVSISVRSIFDTSEAPSG